MNDHKGNKNYFQHNRISTKSSWDNEFDHDREGGNSIWLLTLQGCTTLPTWYKDHVAHPTDYARRGSTHVNRSQQASTIEYHA